MQNKLAKQGGMSKAVCNFSKNDLFWWGITFQKHPTFELDFVTTPSRAVAQVVAPPPLDGAALAKQGPVLQLLNNQRPQISKMTGDCTIIK